MVANNKFSRCRHSSERCLSAVVMVLSLLLMSAKTSARTCSDSLRQDMEINDGWRIIPISHPQRNAKSVAVTIPHTWNAEYDKGTTHYNRETMVYTRNIKVDDTWKGRRAFLYFEGVNSVANVFINHKSVGQHKGGYTAFCIEITNNVVAGDNVLEVWASNAFRTDVLPISGDFNVYGGIHRPVHLIMTSQNCISPLFYASPGLFVHQNKVTRERADLGVETILSLKGKDTSLQLRTTVMDQDGKVVASEIAPVTHDKVVQNITIKKPHLWNGRHKAYLYKVRAELMENGAVVDCMDQITGLRFFNVDKDRGFFLNGQHYDLHGFNKHDDFKGHGSALTAKEYDRDMEVINESGATIIRLAHYPHGESIYDRCDRDGIVVWSEIPLCGPGGYLFTGYLKDVEENGRQVLKEMVYQKFNHPSICFWSVFNEILTDDGKLKEYDDPVPFLRELNALYHSLDPSRLTTFATCANQNNYKGCADLIAWNKYFGWNDADKQTEKFFRRVSEEAGTTPVGVSEYGRGGSALQHVDPLYYKEEKLAGTYHPEEFQAICHENYWKALSQRPDLWVKMVWQLTDAQSAIKNEGDTPGLNDKGMVSYDRSVAKDAFYFYKANWNTDPMLFLCNKKFGNRKHSVTDVKVYTNLPEVTLFINGRCMGKAKADAIHRVVWSRMTLEKGENVIEVRGGKGRNAITDRCVWTVD